MNKYLVKNFKWIENLGKVPAKVYRLVRVINKGYIIQDSGDLNK